MEVTHESGRVRVMPQDVESAPRPEMSSASWRLKSGRVKVVPQDVESPPRTESLRHENLRVNVAPQDVESPPRTDMSSESWRYESARLNFLPQDVESARRTDLSSPSWRLSVQEFPAIAESRVREGGFFTLQSLLHMPSKHYSSRVMARPLSLSLSLTIYIYIWKIFVVLQCTGTHKCATISRFQLLNNCVMCNNHCLIRVRVCFCMYSIV